MSAGGDELLDKAMAGDQKSLEALMVRDGIEVRRAIAGDIPTRWQAVMSLDDVMQQAYAEAFTSFHRFQPKGPGSFAGWLLTLARFTLIDAIRMLEADKRGGDRRQARPAPGQDSLASLYDMLGQTTGTPSRSAAKHEACAALQLAVDQLPATQKQVVEMYDLQGKPVAEVAAALGRSEGAIYLLRVRAHRKLAEIMGAPADYLTRGS